MTVKRELQILGATAALMLLIVAFAVRGGTANQPPVAEAGLPRYAAKDPIRLDGSGSYDPDQSGPLTYAWTQVSGPPLVITEADTATPTISGFVQTEQIQQYEFQLTVRDGQEAGLPDTVRVVIVPMFLDVRMLLPGQAFDPQKPTILNFIGNLADPEWHARANVITLPEWIGDPETMSGAPADHKYSRMADMVIVYLSSIAPNYHQPIQTMGFSFGGLPALDVALRLNLTYADARYAVNHATLIDASSWQLGVYEFQRRVATLLTHPADGELCWVDCYEGANECSFPSALNVGFAPGSLLDLDAMHGLTVNWYQYYSISSAANSFNDGVVAGAYWSAIGAGKNLQLALTPGVKTYNLKWYGDVNGGHMEASDPAAGDVRLPEPVTLIKPEAEVAVGAAGAVLTCRPSANAVGYQLLFGAGPEHMIYLVSDTSMPPSEPTTSIPFEQTWWTIRAYDRHGSMIRSDPVLAPRMPVRSQSIENTRTGQIFTSIQQAINHSQEGDEVVVAPGTLRHMESLDFNGKSIRLRSVDPNDARVVASTILAADGGVPVVTLSAGGGAPPQLEGLTIVGGTIALSCGDATPTIRNCTIRGGGSIAIEFAFAHQPSLINCTLQGEIREGIDPRLIAHWRLDETEGTIVHNATGDWTYDAILGGNPVWRPEGGQVGGALALDGKDDWVGGPFVLNPAERPFSVFVWVKGGGPGQVVISQSGKADWLMVAAPGGGLKTGLSPTGVPALTANVVITDGQWHRIGLVWDETRRSLYADDRLVAQDQDSVANVPGSGANLSVGVGNRRASASYWSGLIDDVRIYDRVVKP